MTSQLCNILYRWSLTCFPHSKSPDSTKHTSSSRDIRVITWGKAGPRVSRSPTQQLEMNGSLSLVFTDGFVMFQLIELSRRRCGLPVRLRDWQRHRYLTAQSGPAPRFPLATLLAQPFTKLVNNSLLRDTVLSGCFKSRLCPEVRNTAVKVWIC